MTDSEMITLAEIDADEKGGDIDNIRSSERFITQHDTNAIMGAFEVVESSTVNHASSAMQSLIQQKVAKKIDVDTIPEHFDAPWLKRFFKRKFGIPVSVTGTNKSGKNVRYIQIRILPVSSDDSKYLRGPLQYIHQFPDDFCNKCLRAVYGDQSTMATQTWGGNVGAHGIAISTNEWKKVLSQYIMERS